MSEERARRAGEALAMKSLYARQVGGFVYVLTEERTQAVYESTRIGIPLRDVSPPTFHRRSVP